VVGVDVDEAGVEADGALGERDQRPEAGAASTTTS
jgi:hypothetical protein